MEICVAQNLWNAHWKPVCGWTFSGFRVSVSDSGFSAQGFGFRFRRMLVILTSMTTCKGEEGLKNAVSTSITLCLLC